MGKNLQYKILSAILTIGVLSTNSTVFANSGGTVDNEGDYVGNNSPSNSTIYIDNGYTGNVYGGKANSGEIINNKIFINGSTITGDVYGGKVGSNGSVKNNYISIDNSTILGTVRVGAAGKVVGDAGEVTDNEVNISNSTIGSKNAPIYFASGTSNVSNNVVNIISGTVIGDNICIGYSQMGTVENNELNISGGKIIGSIRAGTAIFGIVKDNTIKISGTANIEEAELVGTPSTNSLEKNNNNNLIIDGWSGSNGSGNYSVKKLQNFDNIEFKNIKGNTGLMSDTVTGMDDTQIIISSVDTTNLGNVKDHTFGTITLNKTITDAINDFPNKIDTTTLNGWNFNDNGTNGIYVGYIANATAEYDNNNNTIAISGNVEKSVLTGVFVDESGTAHKNTNGTPDDDSDDTTTLTIGNNFKTNAATVAGTYAAGGKNAENGVINITGDTTDWKGTVYAGYSESGSASGNTINVLSATNASEMTLSGSNTGSSQNTLNVTGNGSTFESIENFDTINFNGVALNGANVLTLQRADLNGTKLNVESLARGETFKAGDTVTLISGNIEGTPTLTHDKVTAGLSQDLSVEEITNNSSVKLAVKDVSLNDQIDLVAENRAVAAAFVNQGTDLISDSLDTISRDNNYGVKTFAVVHGNRSKYDVNSDIKINGWSVIAGVGNADKFDNGSEFSWGVFYENSSGNYRTYNEFNNEFFRGDGSLVYNGGGIAARYTNKNGVYTEGSLRAGMLKSDMDNALRDGAGNFYGYESESAYYGAHIGIGKIISLSESSDLDVYGKFFHTYTEGDSFKVANDEFEFDSINSDRLRIGARITSNKENKFSTYYGLAYEYEFNGDADMQAQGLKAPTQSLQGSSVMAEVGFNYQPTPDSPWSFDLNMRGYTGERQGGSFNVQATYTF